MFVSIALTIALALEAPSAPLAAQPPAPITVGAPSLAYDPAPATPPRSAPLPERRGDRPELSIHWGTFGVLDSEVLFEGGFEYRFPERSLGGVLDLQPIVGTSLLADGGIYVYAGARYEHHFAERFFLAPSFAAGLYQDSGVDLGGPLEFRSGLDFGVRVTPNIEAAVGFYHLSNGGIYSINGGSESALFSLAFGR